MLLVIDCCEHVVEATATLAERIFRDAPQVHILATSREALRVEGEHVHRLKPLESPPELSTSDSRKRPNMISAVTPRGGLR